MLFCKACSSFFVGLLLAIVSSFTASGETVSFSEVLADGLSHSFDQKILEENLQASLSAVDEVRADHYPQVSLRFGQEYVHVFDDGDNVVSVGDTVLSDNVSKYKHTLIASARYNLYDFGRRDLNIQSALRQVRIAELQQDQARFDLHRELLSLYSEALKIQKRIGFSSRELAGRQEIYRLSGKLYRAGTCGKEQVATAAMDLAESLSRLEELKTRFQSALNALTMVTQIPYPARETQLEDLKPLIRQDSITPGIESFPEIRIYQQQIERKKVELAIARRAKLPKLTLYSAYRMYGSDDSSYVDSLSDLDARDISITLYLEAPLFDGFASRAKRERLEHEIAGLRYEKRKKESEILNEIEHVQNAYRMLCRLEGEQALQKERIQKQSGDLGRLSDQQMIDRVALIQKQIVLDQRRMETEMQQVDHAMSSIILSFLAEAGA